MCKLDTSLLFDQLMAQIICQRSSTVGRPSGIPAGFHSYHIAPLPWCSYLFAHYLI